jgi:hypothetical protein
MNDRYSTHTNLASADGPKNTGDRNGGGETKRSGERQENDGLWKRKHE